MKEIEKNIIEITGVTHESIKTIGTIMLSFDFENFKRSFRINVVDENFPIPCDGILGNDFFNDYPCTIDYRDNCFKIFKSTDSYFINAMRAKNLVTIPARTELVQKVFVNTDHELICFSKQFNEKQIYVGNCLLKPSNYFAYVPIMNATHDEVTIDLNELHFEKLDSFNVMTMNVGNDNRLNKILSNIELEHLNDEEKTSIIDVIEKYQDVFYLDGDILESTDATTHKINVSRESPIFTRQYRLPISQKEIVNEEVKKMLKNGIIKESNSPWNSPLLVVPKKSSSDGQKKWRIVVDFRKLNDVTISDSYPLPLITDILDQLGKARYFTNLDLTSGFHQIKMDPQDAAKTAFSTQYGHYEYLKMPFGLKNAPATFQRLMNAVLSGLQGVKCFVYMDDVIIYGNNLNEHNKKLCEVLDCLRKFNLKLQTDKCNFLKKEILFLGHWITAEGILPDETKICAIKNFPVPKNPKEIKMFLGILSYYRKFIPNLANLAEPINKLLRKGQRFLWSQNCQRSFDELKSLLTVSPILQYPDFTKKFVITTDASNVAIGAVLSNEGTNLPIAYASRILNPAERHYSTVEKELLAIVWAVKHFKPYVYGHEFVVLSDHKPLVYLFNISGASDRLMRWRIQLEEYDFKVVYTPGKGNVVADALSRIELCNLDTAGQITKEISDEIKSHKRKISSRINVITRNQARVASNDPINNKTNGIAEDYSCFLLLKDSSKNKNISIKIDASKNSINVYIVPKILKENIDYEFDKNVFDSKDIQNYEYILDLDKHFIISKANHKDKICLYEFYRNMCRFKESIKENMNKSINFHFILSTRDELNWPKLKDITAHIFSNIKCRLCFVNNFIIKLNTQDDIQTVLKEFHDNPLGGHEGLERTIKRIEERYSWKSMKQDVKSYIDKCDFCQKNKILRKNKIPMKITSTSSKPFDKIYLDIVGPLPTTKKGNNYILTIQDDLTKQFLAKPIPEATAEVTCRAFLEIAICTYGVPMELVTDRGTNFVSKLFQTLCKLLKIDQIQTTAYHPQSNGALERCHRTMKEYIRSFVCSQLDDWDEYIPFFAFTYNTTVHSSTGFTPHELMFGYKAELPLSICSAYKGNETYFSYLGSLRQNLESMHKIAKDNLLDTKEKRKENYDKKANNWIPLWGDKVLLENIATGVGRKLQGLYNGPHEVIAINSPQTCTLLMKGTNRKITVHNDRLKQYVE